MSRLAEYTVDSALVMMFFFAAFPTRTDPSSRNDTTEACVRSPHSLGMTTAAAFWTTDAREQDLPRPIPKAVGSAMPPPTRREKSGRIIDAAIPGVKRDPLEIQVISCG